jgi:hypothetical protein
MVYNFARGMTFWCGCGYMLLNRSKFVDIFVVRIGYLADGVSVEIETGE